jgi:hypothetical protein
MKKRSFVIYDEGDGRIAVEIDCSLTEADILSQILSLGWKIKADTAVVFENGRVKVAS